MVGRHNFLEGSALAAACVLGGGVGLLILLSNPMALSYPDFIVGNATWAAGGKTQDLLAIPVALLFAAVTTLALARLRRFIGPDERNALSGQVLICALPVSIALASMLRGQTTADQWLFHIGLGLVVALLCVTWANTAHRHHGTPLKPDETGHVVLATALLSLLPLEAAFLLSRAPMSLVGTMDTTGYARLSLVVLLLGSCTAPFLVWRRPRQVKMGLPAALCLAQLGMALFYLCLYPSRFLEEGGKIRAYDTTVWLQLAIVVLVACTVWDTIARFRKYRHTGEIGKCLSPLAFFALVFVLKAGPTRVPVVWGDDYHFGEYLLGWWSYMQGAIPYVDYVAQHGMLDDDLAGFISMAFHDGSAASIHESRRLVAALLGLGAFLAVYRYSASMTLACVTAFLLGGPLPWIFLASVIVFWALPQWQGRPAAWLAMWVATAPLVVLAVPAHGGVLVAASGVMAAYQAWKLVSEKAPLKAWRWIAAAVAVWAMLTLATPVGAMIYGAIDHVLQNASVNQAAYGVTWAAAWPGAGGLAFVNDVLRNGWVFVAATALFVLYRSWRRPVQWNNGVLAAGVALIFGFLVLSYTFGRIEPAGLGRSGHVSIFFLCSVYALIVWPRVNAASRPLVVSTIALLAGSLLIAIPSTTSMIIAGSQFIDLKPVRHGADIGLPNLGTGLMEDDHLDRLARVKAALDKRLPPGEPYLDLTSRNAQYFYLDRLPPTSVTAVYNMVSAGQQQRAIRQLQESPPRVALLGADNIVHDGGGLALRTHHLYRYVVDHYSPVYENGLIIGEYTDRDTAKSRAAGVSLSLRPVANSHGASAAVVEDPYLFHRLGVNERLQLNGEEFTITASVAENQSIVLDRPLPPANDGNGVLNAVWLGARSEITEYRLDLLQAAAGRDDFRQIPVAWGRSLHTLNAKMTHVADVGPHVAGSHDIETHGRVHKVVGQDPFLVYDLSGLNVSGRDAGLLKFDFVCHGETTTPPRIQVFWWADGQTEPMSGNTVRFTAKNGTVIVPLDSLPRWHLREQLLGLRLDLDNPLGCEAVEFNEISLNRRGVQR